MNPTNAQSAAAQSASEFTWRWTGCADADYIEVYTPLGRLFARLPSVDRASLSKGEHAAYEANAHLIAAASKLRATSRQAQQIIALYEGEVSQRIAAGQMKRSPRLTALAINANEVQADISTAIAKAEGR